MQSNAPNSLSIQRKPLAPSAFAPAAARIAQGEDLARWERAIFFEPRLQEAERRAQPVARRLALLLALLLGPLALGSAVAGDPPAEGAYGGSDPSSEQSMTDWLISLILPGDDEAGTDSMKSSETGDPSEGDPS